MSQLLGVHIPGLAAALPAQRVTWQDQVASFGPEASKIADTTGIQTRRIAGPSQCASDLCGAAARSLLDALAWPADSIDALVMVTQTPDRFLPGNALLLHGRLGLAKHAAAFDITLGCSGFIYGLWLTASLVAAGQIKRALLLVGDTISRTVDPQDRATALLFGDAGTATAIERAPEGAVSRMSFALGSDGQGADHLAIPGGGFRAPGLPPRLHMDGAEVFSFTLREVPPLVASVLAESGWSLDGLDHVVLHQANRFLLQHLAKKLKIPETKLVVALQETGNTSGASIPLALVLALRESLRVRPQKLVLAGFGVGWSFGAAALELGPMIVPRVVELEEPAS